jgi:hypothetical protein
MLCCTKQSCLRVNLRPLNVVPGSKSTDFIDCTLLQSRREVKQEIAAPVLARDQPREISALQRHPTITCNSSTQSECHCCAGGSDPRMPVRSLIFARFEQARIGAIATVSPAEWTF